MEAKIKNRTSLAGYLGWTEQPLNTETLPDSFRWHADEKGLPASLPEVAASLSRLQGRTEGVALFADHGASGSLRVKEDKSVLVDIMSVHLDEARGEVVVSLREHAGNAHLGLVDSDIHTVYNLHRTH